MRRGNGVDEREFDEVGGDSFLVSPARGAPSFVSCGIVRGRGGRTKTTQRRGDKVLPSLEARRGVGGQGGILGGQAVSCNNIFTYHNHNHNMVPLCLIDELLFIPM